LIIQEDFKEDPYNGQKIKVVKKHRVNLKFKGSYESLKDETLKNL